VLATGVRRCCAQAASTRGCVARHDAAVGTDHLRAAAQADPAQEASCTQEVLTPMHGIGQKPRGLCSYAAIHGERATIRAEKRRDTFGPTRMDDAVWADMQRLYPQHTKDIG
jgi:hypothetical protein